MQDIPNPNQDRQNLNERYCLLIIRNIDKYIYNHSFTKSLFRSVHKSCRSKNVGAGFLYKHGCNTLHKFDVYFNY